MGKAIVVTSGKGGVGKTTVAANVGAALALMGKKTMLVDTDIGLRNLDIVLGMENKIVYDIVDVCEGICDYKKAEIKDKRFENLSLIPAAQAKDKSAVTPLQMKSLVRKLKEDFDYVIIDCPAGLERGFENAAAGADEAIVVAVPQNASCRDADRIIGLLENAGITEVRLVVNKIRPELVKKGKMLSIEEMTDLLSVSLLGAIVDDDEVIACANEGMPCVQNKKSRAGKAYENIARRINGESVELENVKNGGKGFLRIFGRR